MNNKIEVKLEKDKDSMRYLLCFFDLYEYQIKEFMRIPLQKSDSEYLSQYLSKRLLEEKHKLSDSYLKSKELENMLTSTQVEKDQILRNLHELE